MRRTTAASSPCALKSTMAAATSRRRGATKWVPDTLRGSPFLSTIENGLRDEFSLHNLRRPDSPGRRRCRSAIGGDECDPATVLSTSSPMASRRTDELVVKRIANNAENIAAVFAWL